eukprot:TRINITY_DN20667_c0_g1_i2.p1 TRINITY_DN20667_c0_g1~~TRINITY_DN20667_c0_g1_i2.p1  ORF type:complete len:347 (+),score=67.87 TRINITY_DN20667_c0_g1_i2:26-1066(+)
MQSFPGAVARPCGVSTAKRLTVRYESQVCTLLLVEGADSASLSMALAARFGLGGCHFYLTMPGEDVLVPLSQALPEGLTLQLRLPALLPPKDAQQRPADPKSAEFSSSSPVRPPPLRTPPLNSLTTPLLTSEERDGHQKAPALTLPIPKVNPLVLPLPHGSSHREDLTKEPEHLPALLKNTSTTCFPSPSHANENVASEAPLTTSPRTPFKRQKARMDLSVELESAAKNIDRFSRLSTDLSNERTLLAWSRTSMAAMRTAFAYLSVTAEGTIWMSSFQLSRVAMVITCVVATLVGLRRYTSIKEATFAADPPKWFGRMSLKWFNCLIVASTVAMAFGMMPDGWQKK